MYEAGSGSQPDQGPALPTRGPTVVSHTTADGPIQSTQGQHSVQFSSVQSLSHVQWFATPWCAARQATCLSPTARAYSNSCPLSQRCHPTISSSVIPFSSYLPSIFPSFRVFLNESVLHIRWPKFWSFSFSIGPFNEYSGLISFRMDWSKGLSRVFSKTIVQKHQFFGTQPS